MAVTQTQIDTLVAEIQRAKASIATNFVVGGLNGIRNLELENSLVKLQVIINRLLNFRIGTDTDEYFHDLAKEGRKYCRVTKSASQPLPDELGFFHQRFLTTSANAGSGAAVNTGFSLPSRSTYIYVTVLLIGYNNLTIGDGVTSAEAYFSADGGTTAKSIDNLAQGDVLYLNANVIGAPISTIDQIEITLL